VYAMVNLTTQMQVSVKNAVGLFVGGIAVDGGQVDIAARTVVVKTINKQMQIVGAKDRPTTDQGY